MTDRPTFRTTARFVLESLEGPVLSPLDPTRPPKLYREPSGTDGDAAIGCGAQ
jgi:hypothetical protein